MAFNHLDLEGALNRLIEDDTNKKFEGKPQPSAVERESPYTCFLCGAVMKEDRPHFGQDQKWFYCDNISHGRLSQAESMLKRSMEE